MTSPFANLPRQLVPAFLFLLFWPMFSANGLARPSVVVIDPGHGGHDSGGIPGQRLAEKVYTLDTAKRLARILRNDAAIKVVLTRNSDTFVSLKERTVIAKQYAGRNALFVSVHFNAGRLLGFARESIASDPGRMRLPDQSG